MTVKMTKAEISKLLTEERAKMRSKQRQSAFMRRTLSIYNGQRKRAAESGASIPYTLEEFRGAATEALNHGNCCYCQCNLTLGKLTPDHKTSIAQGGGWGLDNIDWCCQSCNWQKGSMSAKEFRALLRFLGGIYISEASAADVKRRLSIGGKWSFR